jgi:hypothetical protein
MRASPLRLLAALFVCGCALLAASVQSASADTLSFTLQVTGSSTPATFFSAPSDIELVPASNESFTGTTSLHVSLATDVDTVYLPFDGYIQSLHVGPHPAGSCSSLSETHDVTWTFGVNGNTTTLDQPVSVSWICNDEGQIQIGWATTTLAVGNGLFLDISVYHYAGGPSQFASSGGIGAPVGMTLRLHGANSAPVANAGAGQTVQLGDGGTASATLDGSESTDPDGDALAYTWTGDFVGGVATGVRPTVTFGSVGAHTVTLSVDDGHGHTATATTVVRVAYGFTWLTSDPLTVKAGAAIPLTYALTGAPSAEPVVTVTDLGCGVGSTPSLPQESGHATGSPHDRHVVWVWKTPKAYAGSCKQVRVDAGDGVQHALDVTFR